jgi:AmiR/NasT family two-component response regulator
VTCVRGHFNGRTVTLEEKPADLKPNTPVDVVILSPAGSKRSVDSRLKIVVADGDPAVRHSLREILEALGHQVVADVATGDHMVQAVTALAADLVIFEMHLPPAGGLEAWGRIFNERRVAAVAMTADPDPALLRRALKGNVLAYAYKPLDARTLTATVLGAWMQFEEIRVLREEAAALRQALEDRKILERAKAVLQRRNRWTEDRAMKYLQRRAMNERMRIVDVARLFINGGPQAEL